MTIFQGQIVYCNVKYHIGRTHDWYLGSSYGDISQISGIYLLVLTERRNKTGAVPWSLYSRINKQNVRPTQCPCIHLRDNTERF